MSSEHDATLKPSGISKDQKGLSRDAHRMSPEPKQAKPDSCRPTRLQWTPEVQNDVQTILDKSPLIGSVTDRINGLYSVSRADLKSSTGKPHGLTMRPKRPDNRNYVVMQFAISKIRSRFELATILSHELAHADQVLTRGFTSSEAAPFLGPDEYVLLRWVSEYHAYEFQAAVLKEILQTDPTYAICVDEFVKYDGRIEALFARKFDVTRSLIKEDYDALDLKREYQLHFNISQGERDSLSDIADLVARLVVSSEWKKYKAIWA